MSVVAFFTTLNIIGISYSELVEITDNRAVYEYIADKDTYAYSKPLETPEILAPQVETVFYFREYPSVRTGAVEVFIYPTFIAILGLAFALIFRHGTDLLTESSSMFGEYILPTILSILSLIPVCINVYEVCGLYTSVMSAFANAAESVYSASTTLWIINMNLLMWGVWAKAVEYSKKKKSAENENKN